MIQRTTIAAADWCLIARYRGPGATALPTLVEFMSTETGADLDEATEFVIERTGLSPATVERAWWVLLDLDLLTPVGDAGPRPGRHRARHVWVGGGSR
jgi:hypothetical protein